MNVFLWHVHGSWTTAFVQGPHRYFVPVLPDRGPDGRGRAQTWSWPSSVVEVTPEDAREVDVDVVLLQRPEELCHLAEEWLGRRLGHDVNAVYLEHNAPQGRIDAMRHPVADRADVMLVHVTHFNRLFWDSGRTPTRIVEHGIVDPGPRYSGEIPHAVAVVNEPVRRCRVAGADLLRTFARTVPVDLFGIGAEALGGRGNLVQEELHDEMARRRVYLHPYRWTSLGLALIEAMQLGLPVVSLATTEGAEVVLRAGGIASNDLDSLTRSLAVLAADPDLAAEMGRRCRRYARERFALDRFLRDWDAILDEVAT
jgi:glycosyltransferase involved in cell wall biosynthesis